MKTAILSMFLMGGVLAPSAPQVPAVSGTWVATTDSTAALASVPASPNPTMGARFGLAQTATSLTVVRSIRDVNVATTFELGGPETATVLTGATCLGDSRIFETAAVEGDAIAFTLTGNQPAGATAPIKAGVRRLFRRVSADVLVVEMTIGQGAQARQVGTVYRRTAEVMQATPVAAAPSLAASIGSVAWIAGTWSSAGLGAANAAVTEERWTPAAGGAMLAVARDVRNTSMSSFEFLCIVERGGGLVYTAMPNARPVPTDFTLTAVTPTSATFENPAHDYPKKIVYVLQPDGLLRTEVSGAPGARVVTVILKRE